MNLNVLRYRTRQEEDWRTWRFSPATGRLRTYLYVNATRPELSDIASGLVYALTGKVAPNKIHEVALQLSDDGGHTWVVQRRGNVSRVMRDGVALPSGDGEKALASALYEHDQLMISQLEVAQFEIQSIGEDLRIASIGASAESATAQSIKDIAQQQILNLATKCAEMFKFPQLSDPRVIVQLAADAGPVHTQYHELARQFQDLKEETQGFVANETPQVAALSSELELLDKLAEVASPLLQPGVTLKSLKDELAKTDGDVAELCTSMGVEVTEGKLPPCDFRTAIANLSRLEAYSRLIHATQDARRYYQQHLEPAHQRYVKLAETGVSGDRQVAGELEQCLASLQVRLRHREAKVQTSGHDGMRQKTWFDRFKNKQEDVVATSELQVIDEQVAADLETAEMAITYALKRIKDFNTGLDVARQQHDRTLAAIDKAHENLLRSYTKIREQWLTTAKKSALAEDLDLNKLLVIATKHGKLAALNEKRIDLMQKLKAFSANLVKSERLVRDWRQVTGSQNVSDLSNPSILLGEVQGLLRYRDNKRKRLDQMRSSAAEVKASANLRELLKTRRKTLMTTWHNIFEQHNIPTFPIHDDRCPEFLKVATIIEALSLVHVTQETNDKKVAIGSSTDAVVSIYTWDEEKTSQKHRLALLSAIDEATPGEPRIFLIADDDFAAMLAPAGFGRGQLVEKSSTVTANTIVPGRSQNPAQSARAAGAPITSSSGAAQINPVTSTVPGVISDRARRALETLTAKR